MKVKRFFAALPGRLCLFLAAAVVLIFFSNDFGLVDIQKTAIVLAAGIDREGEEFSLTAQIAVPKGSDRTAGGPGVEMAFLGGRAKFPPSPARLPPSASSA